MTETTTTDNPVSPIRADNILAEFRRGNCDLDALAPPLFFLTCKIRFRAFHTDDIRRYQAHRARNIARYAVRYAPFFRRLYADCDLEDIWSLPTVDKRTMMDHLGEYNTLGLGREEILDFCARVERSRDFSLRLRGVNVGLSSGTSGNKGVEIATRREEAYMRAALLARFPFPPGKLNVAFILRVSSPAFTLGGLGHRLTYISQLISLPEMCARLARLEPNVLAAPPSILRLLAREMEGGRLALAPTRIVSYAEVLYPEDRTYLRAVFGCPVFEIYKASEGPIAISCREGSLHINEDMVAVELLNQDGTPAPPGQPAPRMLVTDLHKTSQPILRYALNDVLTIRPERCSCGSAFRVIEQIQGRADDLFWGRRADDGSLQFISPDYIRRAIILVSDRIQEYQATQTAPDAVQVRLQLAADSATDDAGIEAEVRAGVERIFAAYGCQRPQVTVDWGLPEPNPQSGKLVRIRRTFEVER